MSTAELQAGEEVATGATVEPSSPSFVTRTITWPVRKFVRATEPISPFPLVLLFLLFCADEFDTGGHLIARIATHGQLNAPWGVAMAPQGFGRFSGDLLIGNFGDGQINAYAKLPNGHFEHRGELRDPAGKALAIDGLWALEFGNDGGAGPSTRLFFTAGPHDEQDGLFGSIDPN